MPRRWSGGGWPTNSWDTADRCSFGGIFFVAGYVLLGMGSIATYYTCSGTALRRQRLLQAEHLDDGRQPLSGQQPAQRFGLQHFLHGDQYRRVALAARRGRGAPVACGADVLDMAKKGQALSADQAASLRSGFLTAFYAAAAGMTLGTVILLTFYRKLADADRRHVPLKIARSRSRSRSRKTFHQPGGPHCRSSRYRNQSGSWRLLVIYGIVIVFWMVFHQNGSTMTYWADENTAWKVSGVVSNAINPFWIVVLSLPARQLLELAAEERARAVNADRRWRSGCCSPVSAFLILFVAAKSGGDQTFVTDAQGQFVRDKQNELEAIQHQVSPLWLIAAYMVISLGELMLSPMGLSLVSKVAPTRMRGLMMGGWFVATAIGNKLTIIGILWTEWYHSSFWLLCSLLALGMTFVLLLLLRPLKKAMPGV